MKILLSILISLYLLPAYSQQYNGGYIPDEIKPVYLDSKLPENSFKNPYEGIVTPSPYLNDSPSKSDIVSDAFKEFSERKSNYGEQAEEKSLDEEKTDPITSSLDSFSQEPASIQSQIAPQSFDYNATNADRFINSPCYKLFGFDPIANPIEQERKYSECENERSTQRLKNIGVILGLISLFGLVIFMVIKKKAKFINAIYSGENKVLQNFKPNNRLSDSQNSNKASITEELTQLKKMLDEGALTREEYDVLKKKMLDNL